MVNPIGATPDLGPGAFLRPRVPSLVDDPDVLRRTNMVELGAALARLGHPTTVLVGDLYLGQRPWTFDNGLRVLPLSTVLRTPFHPGLLPMTPGLTSHPALREADIVQVVEFHQPSTYFAAAGTREIGAPLVLWQETFDRMRAPGSLYQRAFEATAGRYVRNQVRSYIPRTTKARTYLERLGIPPESIGSWVPSGVDAQTFTPGQSALSPEDFGWSEDVRILLLVARLHPIKGVDLAIRALAEVRRDLPETRLLVAGSGPERPRLRRQISDLHLEEEVRLLGQQGREELVDLYRLADIVLNSSRKDLLPFSLMEASACGRPCVASDVGAVRDIVADGETGLVVAQDESHTLAAAILSLLRDDDLRATFGSAARARMEEHFAFTKVATNLLEVYRGTAG